MKPSPDQITAVVLAGGFGTRIKHLLGDLPKPMAPVNGKPFVEWVVRYLAAQGVRNVVLSTGYQADTVEKHFRSQPVRDVRIACVPETTPLGTAGGFLNATSGAGEKPAAWLVLNGDSLVLAPLDDCFRSLDDATIAGSIVGVQVPDASRFGTLSRNAAGDAVGFAEKRPGAGVINAGIYLFRASTIDRFPRKTPLSFETEVFPALLAAGLRMKVCVTDAPFLDIGTPESLPQAEQFIRRHAGFFEP